MANLKDLKNRIASITSTQKITKAMKMVAAANVKKTENAVKSARPFSLEVANIFKRLYGSLDSQIEATLKIEKAVENYPALLQKREKKTVGLLVLSSNKGLAGAYNANVSRLALRTAKEYAEQGIKTKLFIVGQKGLVTIKRGLNPEYSELIKSYTNFSADVTYAQAQVLAEDIATEYVSERIDSIEIITTRFKNMMSYSTESWQILPLDVEKDTENHGIDPLMEFEPDKNGILRTIVPLFISNTIYQAMLEAVASELASRMMAMSAASNNAEEMIRLLTIDYNKARQYAITQEINEVVSGATSLK